MLGERRRAAAVLDLSGLMSSMVEYYGVLGVFIVSFLGNCIPYSTIPYVFVIIFYASTVKSIWMHLAVTFAGGLGAALGKMVVYYTARAARRVIPGEVRESMEVFARYAGKSVFYAVLLFAALPLPDDVLYVPLGLSRYNPLKFFAALLIGKIFITGLSVFLGATMGYYLGDPSSSPLLSIPSLLVLTGLLTYIVIKIDWVEITRIAGEKGRLYAFLYLIYVSLKIIYGLFAGAARRAVGLARRIRGSG